MVHGLDALAERVAPFTPEYAASLTGVSAADIAKAADLYAAGPSVFVQRAWHRRRQQRRADLSRWFHCLVAISGNVDREGGNWRAKSPAGFTTYMNLLHDPRFRLPKDVELQTIGRLQLTRCWAGPEAGWQTACHNKSVLDAIFDLGPISGAWNVRQWRQHRCHVSRHASHSSRR